MATRAAAGGPSSDRDVGDGAVVTAGAGDGEACAAGDGDGAGDAVGDGAGEGLTEGVGVGVWVGAGVARTGTGASVGRAVGAGVGARVGGGVGAVVGAGVGAGVGAAVGAGVGGAVAWLATVTVPRIVGWTAQKYPYVPGLWIVTVRLPDEKTPVSNALLSALAEWGIPSRFVHVTDSPALIVTLAGVNVALWMVTAAFAAYAAAAGSATSAAATSHTRVIRSRIMTVADAFVALQRDAARLGLRLSDAQRDACARYAAELIEATKAVNLTAITEPRDVAVKHFLDSFTAYAARPWSGHERLVDVGSGAGFPGLALRIALPGIGVTAVESTGKKARAIEAFRDTLGLERVDVQAARAEDVARTPAHRGRYDVATARALGTLGLCVELLFPFLRIGGDAIVWKGRIDAELDGAKKALHALGGEIVAVIPTTSLGLGDELPGRQLVVMRKTRATAEKYPRSAAELKRRPW